MVGRVLNGALNLAGGVVGGVGNTVTGLLGGPGKSEQAPGHGGTPPGQAKKHASPEVQQTLQDNFAPQGAPPPVDLEAHRNAPRAEGPPEIKGRKGPAGQTPWISQYTPGGADESYQNGAANCAPAVAASIARNVGFGKDLSDAALINELGQVGGTDATGTSGNGLIAMYEHMGLDTNATQGANLDWITAELQAGHHVNALGDFYQVPGRVDPELTSGHYLGITGLTKEGNFLVNDPADPNVTMMTRDELSAFIGAAPEGGFAVSAWKPKGAGE